MKTLFHKFFVQNWQRKAVAIFLAIIVWFVVNHSLTGTKTISNIPIRVINLPVNKTIEGLQPSGLLSKKVSLTLLGNISALEEISSNDLEVLIDAAEKPDEWTVTISKRNLMTLNPEIDLTKDISRVFHQNFTIKLTKLVTEKIPVIITTPIGDAPRDYQWIDIWPYHLYVTVQGSEEIVKHLKTKGVKMTFNLNKIQKRELDALQIKHQSEKADEVSYFVPDEWKQVNIPLLSDSPIAIDDPQAKALRIDFIRSELYPLNHSIPINIYYPPRYTSALNPDTCKIGSSTLVSFKNSIPCLDSNLYVKGVSSRFLSIVREMLQVSVIAAPSQERPTLEWSLQFATPQALEDRYVASFMSDDLDISYRGSEPSWKEEYLRNRFRNYMNRIRLYKANNTKLDLKIELHHGQIIIEEKQPKKQ